MFIFIRLKWAWLMLAWGCALAALPLHAAPAPGLDVVIVMDSSGSMKKTDPRELRKPAAKLLVSLLGAEDRAAIVSFSDQGYPVLHLTPARGARNEQQLFAAIGRISSKGAYTNLVGALEGALKVLEKTQAQGRRRIVVLMSDGRMDLGAEEPSKEATRRLIKEMVPGLKQRGIELHTIAFTGESDRALLESMASLGGGYFNMAQSDSELHQVFTAIFEQNKAPDILPFAGEQFTIDTSVKEVTIVASKENAATPVRLTAPDKQVLSAGAHPGSVKWLASDKFDLITITEPAPGAWKIEPSTEKNRAYIITDLRLALETRPEEPKKDDELQVAVWLEDQGQVITREAIHANLALTLTALDPHEKSAPIPLAPVNDATGAMAGRYSGKLALPGYGRYQLEMVARAPTFERKKVQVLNIIPPLNPDKVLHALETGAKDGPIDLPALSEPVEKTQQTPPPEVKEHKEPEKTHEAPAKQEHAPASDTAQGSGLVQAVIIFVAINAVLGALGGAAYYFYRRKRKAQPAPAKAAAAEEKPRKTAEPPPVREEKPEKPSEKPAEPPAAKSAEAAVPGKDDVLFEEMTADDTSSQIADELKKLLEEDADKAAK